ncbi:hypothetical protein QYE76_000171 [Lolium multiflorum]|uniref:RNase H type-1 domain-containing protein n=1 Tax=Lolium multiflorum TaxID=4521 RepID=A0AAD8RLD4_LOLMU|nr:hypothetical protein QYE76_000171 [Lolium multiflorum]
MNFEGSKRVEGAGAGVILVSPQGDKMKYILRMTFPNASNNEAEYEALIHGMKMAKACGMTRLKIFGDSQLVAQQVMNKCDAVNDSMIAYKEVYNELEKLFDGCEVNHISRLSNDEADVLANISSQCLPIPPGVYWEEIIERSTKAKKAPKQAKKKEKAKEGLGAPAAQEVNALEDDEEPEEVMMIEVPWMQIRKISGLRIPRKHSIVYHGQCSSAELKKFSDLNSTILESNNSSGAILASPKITTILSGKLEKDFNSRVNVLIFSSSINKGT